MELKVYDSLELEDIFNTPRSMIAPEDAAKAQARLTLQQVVEWLDEKCPHATGWNVQAKRKCEMCWQEKLKEWGIEL